MKLHLKERSNSIDEKIKSLKEDLPGICFGSKKLFKQQYITGKYPDHDTWLRSFRKRRSSHTALSKKNQASVFGSHSQGMSSHTDRDMLNTSL